MSQVLAQCVVHHNGRVLLGMKKRGLGTGWWNHAGGHVEEGETIVEAAQRELIEECGITALSLEKRGVFTETFEDSTPELEVHVFVVSDYEGEISESDEMAPQWFSIDTIPYHEMWPDDRYWLPLVLDGKRFRARHHFRDTKTMLWWKLEEVTEG